MRSFPLWLLSGALAGLCALSGCSRSAAATPKEGGKAAAAVQRPIKVETVPVKEEAMPRVLPLTGTLTPFEDSSVAAGAAGKVVATNVERGQRVKKGDVMVKLDGRIAAAQAAEASAAAEMAKAQAEVSKSECDRSGELFKGGGVAASQHERTMANCKVTGFQVAASEARANLTANALADTNIRAPFDGVVAERHVSMGEYVTPATPVVTLLAADQLRLELTVPEANASEVRVGQTVSFTSAASVGQSYEAKITFVGPAVRKGSRDVVVEAVVDNKAGKLTPGSFAQARLKLEAATLPVVPKQALARQGEQARIYVVKDGRLEERLVQLGEASGDRISVVRGVTAGEQVVSMATPDLRDGARVE